MDSSVILEEENKLASVISSYEDILEDTKLEYKNVYSLYKDNLDLLESKKKYLQNRITLLDKNIEKPYFARIDFFNEVENYTDKCYIGKVGISDYDDNIVTVDWRSPIASLYYDSNIGKASFSFLGKRIDGKLILKRQYDIENRKLLNVRDVDAVSNDELLKPYLGVSADARLKNIVSTIQSEQNAIIRSNINDNLIVQGVAGSGKTTVALHRIAYLVYNYRDKFSSDQFMVIGPNKFFINYISSILPDLDVSDVPERDIHGFLEEYMGQNIKLVNSKKSVEFSKLVGSMEFKKIIDEYFKDILLGVKDTQVKIKSFTLLSSSEINNILKNENLDNYDNMRDLIDRYVFLLNKYVEDNKERFLEKLNNFIDNKLKDDNLLELRKERDFIRGEIKKNTNSIIKSAFKVHFKNPVNVYKDILNTINMECDNLGVEDIAPLLYINYKIYGNKDYLKYKHVVIDEAQDYGDLTFYALKTILKNATFSIYGDLAQALTPNKSISTWESVKDVFEGKINITNLSKSYRTSIEIMNEANKINRFLSLNEAIPVIRHGEDVKYIKFNDFSYIKECVVKLKNKGYQTIGIISKSDKRAREIYDYLKEDIDINYIGENNPIYEGGICSLTGVLSKGLEFDAVIISDADNCVYNTGNSLDMKILYVSMTRALHEMIVLYNEELVSVLKEKN